MKKIILCLFALLFLQNQALAGNCPEDSVVEEIKKAQTDFITEIYDTAVGNPSDSREFANCLSSIEDIGDIFSMGISLPSMDDILDKVCDELDHQLKNAINEAKDKVKELLTHQINTGH